MGMVNGNKFKDDRGILMYNNKIDISEVKRFYTIQNQDINIVRGWQGHTIERRWFSVMKGSFSISVLKIGKINTEKVEYKLNDDGLNCLLVPPGYMTSIQDTTGGSILLVMSDYLFGETGDEVKRSIAEL